MTQKEREASFQLNPSRIRKEVVHEVREALGEDPTKYVTNLRNRWIKDTPFADMIHPEFQVFRIGSLGFELPVTPEDREQFGIILEEISAFGREGIQVPETEDIGYDWLEGINSMRALVASSFFEEAQRQKLPIPQFNPKLIDPPPAKKEDIPKAYATKPGLFLYEWEALQERWKQENPELYEEVIKLKEALSPYYVARLLNAYKDLPTAYLEKIEPEVKNQYDYNLLEYALRTYAMFTPHPPVLLEVTKVKPQTQ